MRSKTRKAFTLTEVLIGLLITATLGGTAVSALWFFVNSFSQMDDYTTMDTEMEHVVQRLARDFALIGLGMPNNRGGKGSFALSFMNRVGSSFGDRPIMARFGAEDDDWGGPVTVSSPDATALPARVPRHSCAGGANCYLDNYFVGPELYYAWAARTGVMVKVSGPPEASDGTDLTLALLGNSAEKKAGLLSLRQDGRSIGLLDPSPPPRDMRAWLLLPTLRLPMFVVGWSGTDLNVRVASAPGLEREIMALDEIHLIQAARLYRRGGELRRTVFGANYTDASANTDDFLARNVADLWFAYNPDTRLLKMFIAVRGNERYATGSGHIPDAWPSCLPKQGINSALDYRLLVKNTTWRIRN